MPDSVERAPEAEPLKGGHEEAGKPNGHGRAGKVGVAKMTGWRTASFLISVFLCLSVIFAFSFILPCPVRPQYLHSWNITLPAAETYDFLAVADASKDKVMDVFFTYKSTEGRINHTCTDEGLSSPCLFVLAVDGTKGRSLWERPLSAEFHWAQCDMGEVGDQRKLCLVAHGDDKLTAVDIYTGKILWQTSRSSFANSEFPVISLPDVDNDDISDIAVISYTTNASAPAEFVFLSGKSGNPIGSKVDVVTSGRMIAHHQYTTSGQAQYILLHTDLGLFALGVWRLAASAQVQYKLKQERIWDDKADATGLIPLYSSDSLMHVLKVSGKSSSSSPPLLLITDSTVMLLNTHTFTITWATNTSSLLSTPTFGHFNKDGVLDIMLEEDLKNSTKRVLIVNGQTGSEMWQVHLPFQFQYPKPATVLTNIYYSVFMIWGDSYAHLNDTDLVNEESSLYLLHPLHSDVLLEKRTPFQNITSFKASLLERGRHACYFILTGENGSQTTRAGFRGDEPVILTKRKVKDNISRSTVLKVSGTDGLSEDVSPQLVETVKEAFHRLRFSSNS